MKLSVVIPVYKGEQLVDELVKRLVDSLSLITEEYQIILIEDGSTEDSWSKVKEIASANKKVKGILLSRNYGQHPAIYAGLTYAKGEWVVVMDCDLQDRPEEIIRLYGAALQGHHIVLAQRFDRSHSFIKTKLSQLFYFILAYLTDTDQDSTVANFGIYHRKVVDSILSMGDRFKYFPAMVKWVGFKKTKLAVQHDPRFEGKSNYSLKKLFNLGLEVVLTFSNKPLRIILNAGLMISLLSLIMAVRYIWQYFNGDIKVAGFASLIVSIWFFSGIVIFLIGVLGLYLGKLFDQAKNRPVFLIEEEIN
ncbi:MAG: glycosyltransferase family 2 protein [Bacteroidia bacterium]